MAAKRVQSPNWVFTLNNPVSNDIPRGWSSVAYCIWQLEEVSCPHLQGYVVFSKKLSLSSLKTLCPTAHWEPRRGSHSEARDYCTKEGAVEGPWTIGQEPKQGHRSDLEAIRLRIADGATDKQIADETFGSWCRYSRAFSTYRLLLQAKKDRGRPEVLIVYGPSGVGKTRTVRDAFPNAYWKDKGQWWDGYSGEDTVIFDEFFGWYPYHGLKRVIDYGRLRVETKGSHVPLVAHRFVFTSNLAPWHWYSKVTDTSDALYRRFKEYGILLKITVSGWQWRGWKEGSMMLHPKRGKFVSMVNGKID